MIFLISACLAGQTVRYDQKIYQYQRLQQFIQTHTVITACPEMLGGLACPRRPAEIILGTAEDVLLGHAKVIDDTGVDVSQAFIDGAYHTLKLAQQHDVTTVVLKENSPSCGSQFIYDGQFKGQKIRGAGVTATLLRQHGFHVISETEFLNML